MANISSIKLPNGTTYTLKDNGALQLTGGTVTGPTIFENSVDIDEATVGDLVATGAVTFTNYPTTIATSSGTNQLTLISNTKYVLTTPGGSFIFTTPVDTNTWRGIQDNLTSSSNTTESLSAKQGYLLANGSARDSTKLPLVGGTMTGQILINQVGGPKINSNNIDLKVWEVVGNAGSWNSEYGFHELYKGTGGGNDNTLELYAHNQSGTHVKVRTIKQDGTVTWHTTQTFSNTIQGNVSGSAGSVAWTGVTGKPTATGSSTTGISIAAHGTGTVIGVQSTTTTASKVTVGSHSTDYGVKAAGSASTWTFEEKTIPNVTSAGSASSWTFEEKTIPNVTAAGSGSASLTFAMDTTDTKKLKITFSHTHTAPTIGTAIKVQSKSGGSNGTAPTLGTAIKVQSKSGGANSTAPTLGSKVPTVSASDVTVPIKNTSASTFVTGTSHTVTDNGHTHSIG